MSRKNDNRLSAKVISVILTAAMIMSLSGCADMDAGEAAGQIQEITQQVEGASEQIKEVTEQVQDASEYLQEMAEEFGNLNDLDLDLDYSELFDAGQDELEKFLGDMDPEELGRILAEADPEELSELISNADPDTIAALFGAADPEGVAAILDSITPENVEEILKAGSLTDITSILGSVEVQALIEQAGSTDIEELIAYAKEQDLDEISKSLTLLQEAGIADLEEAAGALTEGDLQNVIGSAALEELVQAAGSVTVDDLIAAAKDTGLTEVADALSSEEAQAALAAAGLSAAQSSKEETAAVADKTDAVDDEKAGEEEKVESVTVTDEQKNGIRTLSAELPDAEYLYGSLMLDASSVPYDHIHDFVLLGDMLGSVATENYTVDELEQAAGEEMYSFRADTEYYENLKKDEVAPYLGVKMLCPEDEAEEAAGYVSEVLCSSDFSDVDRDRDLIENIYSDACSFNEDEVMADAGLAAQSSAGKYCYYAEDLEYLAYLEDLLDLDDDALLEKMEDLQEVLQLLQNSNGLIVEEAGSKDAMEAFELQTAELAENFSAEKLPAADYSEELSELELADSMALITDAGKNYNMVILNNPGEWGLENNGSNQVALELLKSSLLRPAFCTNIGAADSEAVLTDDYVYFCTFDDPEVGVSLDIMERILSDFGDIAYTQDEVDEAIRSVCASYDEPESRLNLAISEMEYILEDRDITYSEDIAAKLNEAKLATPETIEEAAEGIRNVVLEGAWVSGGNKAGIMEEKDRFELILNK